MTNSHLFLRKSAAYGVHLFTASGAVWGFMAMYAILNAQWKVAILWMVLAMFVDGFDGILARRADVKNYAPNIDGGLLDNILDYFNYVIVPAVFFIEAPNILPNGWNFPVAFIILLVSAYQFTQSDAKTDGEDDYFFKGFPSYWNVVAVYMLVMQWNVWINLGFLLLFSVLVFVPIKYIYQTRSGYLKKVTLGVSYLYAAIGVWGIFQYPDVPKWVVWSSFVYVGYYVVLSFLPKDKLPLKK